MTEQEENTEEQLPPPAASYRSPEPGEMAGSYHREDSAGTIKVKNYYNYKCSAIQRSVLTFDKALDLVSLVNYRVISSRPFKRHRTPYITYLRHPLTKYVIQ